MVFAPAFCYVRKVDFELMISLVCSSFVLDILNFY